VVLGGGVLAVPPHGGPPAAYEVGPLERDQVASGASVMAFGLPSFGMHWGLVRDAVEHAVAFFGVYDGHRNVEYRRLPGVMLARSAEVETAPSFAARMCEKGFDGPEPGAEDLEARFPRVIDLDVSAGGLFANETNNHWKRLLTSGGSDESGSGGRYGSNWHLETMTQTQAVMMNYRDSKRTPPTRSRLLLAVCRPAGMVRGTSFRAIAARFVAGGAFALTPALAGLSDKRLILSVHVQRPAIHSRA